MPVINIPIIITNLIITIAFNPSSCQHVVASSAGRYKARRQVSVLASRVYEKCIDPQTRQVYFFNPRTGFATWNKPRYGRGPLRLHTE
jgi:hypothetical protein